MILYETDSLILRSFTRADLEPFYNWRNDPYVARYQGWQVPYTREKAADFVADMEVATPGRPNQWYQVAVAKKETGELIGDCAFRPNDSGIQTQLGYSLATQYHRQGLGSQAVQGMVNYLFESLSMHRISAYCDTRNKASWKLLKKLGFRLEGHYIENYRDGGSWASEYHYALLKREWETRN